MKKVIIGIVLVLGLSFFREVSLEEKLIPDEAIRFRVLANSNSDHDQLVKEHVKDKLQGEMYTLLKETTNVTDARVIIKENMTGFNETVSNVLAQYDPKLEYSIDFGTHYFPNKEYKGIEYKEGYYESLLVKLGAGAGDNWWCVLFPPLCLLEAEESSEVEYKFFVKELIDKFF